MQTGFLGGVKLIRKKESKEEQEMNSVAAQAIGLSPECKKNEKIECVGKARLTNE